MKRLSQQNKRKMRSFKGNTVISAKSASRPLTPSPVPSPAQSDDGDEKGEANDDEEGASDVPMEHTSNDVGVAGDAARPVAGIAKKRRCLGSVDVLQEVGERD